MTTTFTKRVVASGDDGYTNAGLGFNNNAAYAAFGNVSPDGVNGFFRFTNITIPKGATINSAKLTFQAQASQSGTSCITKIHCNAADNAAAPTTSTDHNNKVRTTNFSNWTAAAQTANSNYDSADFTSAVQEVINRTGWVAGNALMVLIDNNGSSANAYRLEKSYDTDTSNCALLTITYTAEDTWTMIF